MLIETIDRNTYERERVICGKAESLVRGAMGGRGGTIPGSVVNHPDYKACDNAMRGRVEQYELVHHTPERLTAYVGDPVEIGTAFERARGYTVLGGRSTSPNALTVWTGAAIGTCHLGASWRINSALGSRMFQVYAWIGKREFTGRSMGVGMYVNLRETAASKRRRA